MVGVHLLPLLLDHDLESLDIPALLDGLLLRGLLLLFSSGVLAEPLVLFLLYFLELFFIVSRRPRGVGGSQVFILAKPLQHAELEHRLQ